jgi:2-dehydro-3-deoxygalactonokinase
MTDAALIALDWGTTSLRAYLLDGAGRVLDSRAEQDGVMHLPPGGFREAFDLATRGWPSGLPALASGMVGSNAGWVEAPYAPCPAGPEDLAARLAEVPEVNLRIVPGAMQRDPAPDVMRGEETQVMGALKLHPDLARGGALRLLHPGTHSKWIAVEGGRIAGFQTFMTGEVFAVLRAHSILGRPAAAGPPPDEARAEEAFARGVRAVRERGRASPLLFSARARVLAGDLPANESLDYLSGLLIGEELAGAELSEPVLLFGAPALRRRYARALALWGAPPPLLQMDDAEATVAGLWRVARLAGLVPEGARAS